MGGARATNDQSQAKPQPNEVGDPCHRPRPYPITPASLTTRPRGRLGEGRLPADACPNAAPEAQRVHSVRHRPISIVTDRPTGRCRFSLCSPRLRLRDIRGLCNPTSGELACSAPRDHGSRRSRSALGFVEAGSLQCLRAMSSERTQHDACPAEPGRCPRVVRLADARRTASVVLRNAGFLLMQPAERVGDAGCPRPRRPLCVKLGSPSASSQIAFVVVCHGVLLPAGQCPQRTGKRGHGRQVEKRHPRRAV